jgi:hypothetical protein
MIRQQLRTLATASLLAVGLLSGPVLQAHAEDNGGGTPAVTCSWGGTTYSPGGVVTEPDGTKHTCQKDGTWSFQVHLPRHLPGVQQVAPVQARQ